jgi:hypothetical protein
VVWYDAACRISVREFCDRAVCCARVQDGWPERTGIAVGCGLDSLGCHPLGRASVWANFSQAHFSLILASLKPNCLKSYTTSVEEGKIKCHMYSFRF